jgi:hypothetical protein
LYSRHARVTTRRIAAGKTSAFDFVSVDLSTFETSDTASYPVMFVQTKIHAGQV